MASLLITYLVLLLLVFTFQRKLIYLPERHSPDELAKILPCLGLAAWPASTEYRALIGNPEAGRKRGTVLIFHGNAGSAAGRFFYKDALENLGFRVLIAEYPGYGGRGGTPSEKALVEDGIRTAAITLETFGEPLYLWGESLGSGVASGVIKSGRIAVNGLILLMPFDNLPNIAQAHYWFFLGKWLTRDKFDNVRNLVGYTGRTAVILAGNDEVIPGKHTLRVFESLAGEKKLWRLENAGHNSLPLEPDEKWWGEVMDFTAGQ
ncbi:MAG: alpha/beta hydrolase [Gammaproteobacteria bacterium]